MKGRQMGSGMSRWWPPKVLVSMVLLVWGVWAAIAGTTAPMGASVLLSGGAGIHLWHYSLLKRAVGALGSPTNLLTRGGFFALVRHPMYLGDLIMCGGAAWMAGDVVGCLLLVLLSGVMLALCHDEDRMMLERFGEEFRAWRARTKLLLPFIY